MNYRAYRNVFLATLAAAIVVDCAFDLFALRQSFVIGSTKTAMDTTHRTLQALNDMSAALRDNLEAQIANDARLESESVTLLRENLLAVRELTADDPLQQERLENFAFLNGEDAERQVRLNSKALSQMIANARRAEVSKLDALTDAELAANRKSQMQILWASLLDLVLMGVAAVIWQRHDRARRSDERELTKAIALSQKTNLELREMLETRAQELRATVHDLKNPLGSIKGYSGLIDEERHNPATVGEMSQILQRISEHTLALVNSLVETEAERATYKFDLRVQLQDVCLSLKPQTQQKGQRICFTPGIRPVWLRGDQKRMWDVFMNLVGNAVKYSPNDSEITIHLTHGRDAVRIEIEDQGPGFSEADKARAFGRFQRLSALPSGDETSHGLGLWVAREIIREHGGTIAIEDGPAGVGARVRVELPLDQNRAALEQA